jgi:hypothetical protein
MKTALTELIAKWESEMGSYIPNAPIYKSFIEEAKTFLEKEKQQIIDAFESGVYDGGENVSKYNMNSEQYYNELLKNK